MEEPDLGAHLNAERWTLSPRVEFIRVNVATLENTLAVSQKVKHKSTMWPNISLLGTQRNENTKTCTRLLIATLFLIASNWKQPKCPSVDEEINTIQHIYIIK